MKYLKLVREGTSPIGVTRFERAIPSTQTKCLTIGLYPELNIIKWISSYECTERLRFWVLATASHRVILRTILKKLTENPYSVSSIIMGREGLEPSVFLMLRIYSPLPSPLGIPTHIQDT